MQVAKQRVWALWLGMLVFSTTAGAETVFITGANRGIGLEFAKQYAAKGWTVIATRRREDVPESLVALMAQYDKVSTEQLDVTDHPQIDALAEKLADVPIDLLINNAGITGNFFEPAPQSFGTLDFEQFHRFVQTNAVGALKVSEAFASNVKASKGKKIVAITSLAGSFGTEAGGPPGAMWYKASKTTLNMFMVNVATALRKDGVAVALLSPGEVRVEKLANIKSPRFIEPDVSISGMIEVIDGLSVETTGAFIRYNGEAQPF
jgi:NAD(P)-dependent dehydrogenase (short-subunit alcohol dehydrogenase family)